MRLFDNWTWYALAYRMRGTTNMNLRIIPSLFIALPLLACSQPDGSYQNQGHYEFSDESDPSYEVYDTRNLVRFDIELSRESLDNLESDPREYTTAIMRYRGEILSDVGIRLKGEYSFRDMDGKPGFKIKFDKFTKGQRFRGLKRLTLNNNVQDPSFLSQPLSYELFREANLPAPRANSALVYVNGEYYGVYSNVETEDKVFLSRWFASNDGNLYEEGEVDFLPGNASVFDLETNEETNDRSGLEALIRAIDESTPETFYEKVGAELDMPQYLHYVAIEAIVGGWDGYSYGVGSRNNFRIYRDPSTDKFVFLPWGLDRGLRPRLDPQQFHDWLGEVEVSNQSVWEAHGILLEKCIASPRCKSEFITTLWEMTTLFESLEMSDKALTSFGRIADAGYADPRKEEDNEYLDYALELLIGYVETRPTAIREEL